MVLVYPVVAFLLRMKPTAEKRYGDRQYDSNANESHDESSLLRHAGPGG